MINFKFKTLCSAKQNISLKNGNSKGFTLIELLIVIAIMSILTTITVGQFSTAQKKARDVARKGDLSSLYKAIMAYYADYGKFPSTNATNPIDINSMWGGAFIDNGYTYMNLVPQENYKKNGIPEYCYVVSNDQKSFALFAMLENRDDADCKSYEADPSLGKYSHCTGKRYCYSMVSPNTDVNSLNVINP